MTAIQPKQITFFVQPATRDKLIWVGQQTKAGAIVNVLVKGRQGCGKTALPEQYAARLKRPYYCFEIGLLSEAGQLLGEKTLDNGKISFDPHQFLEAIQTAGAVITLNEINRAEHPKALNDLVSILDDNRRVWVQGLHQMVEVAKGITIFATMNEGAEFTGTDKLDSAIRDRFYVIDMDYIPAAQESLLIQQRCNLDKKAADQLCETGRFLRTSGFHISTRKIIDAAIAVAGGLDLRPALEFSWGLEKDALETALLQLHLHQDIAVEAESYVEL